MISVVLVNWNGWKDTLLCVQSLLDSCPTQFRIIVVDNASTDGSFAKFLRWSEGHLDPLQSTGKAGTYSSRHFFNSWPCSFIEYHESSKSFSGQPQRRSFFSDSLESIYFVSSMRNGGFGAGCNIGIRLSQSLGSDVIWLLNNDCIVTSTALSELHHYVSENPKAIVGAHLKYFSQPQLTQAIGGGTVNRFTGRLKLNTDANSAISLDYIHGASMAFSRTCAETVGFFDEKIFMYCEEVDYCLRARLNGYNMEAYPIVVFHKEGGSQGGGPSSFAWSQVLVNKYYVFRKSFGRGPWLLFFWATLLLKSFFPIAKLPERKGARLALLDLIFGFEK